MLTIFSNPKWVNKPRKKQKLMIKEYSPYKVLPNFLVITTVNKNPNPNWAILADWFQSVLLTNFWVVPSMGGLPLISSLGSYHAQVTDVVILAHFFFYLMMDIIETQFMSWALIEFRIRWLHWKVLRIEAESGIEKIGK